MRSLKHIIANNDNAFIVNLTDAKLLQNYNTA